MFSGYQEVNVLDFDPGLMNAETFCFRCEQMFSTRRYLEEHSCSRPSFICSCGTEFTSYNDMLKHSNSHEPGHQVIYQEAIKKQKIEKNSEEEEKKLKLKRLFSGEVVWESPKSLLVNTTTPTPSLPKVTKGSAQSHVLPQIASNLNKSVSTLDTSKMFSSIGAPTVDLWTLFQPVVVVKMMRSISKINSFLCGKCGQSFTSRRALVIHHNTHIADKVLGCIGCGLLLSSRKIVPRFHPCNTPYTKFNRFKLITARPITQFTANIANGLGQLPVSPVSTKNVTPATMNKNVVVDYLSSSAKQPFKPIQIKPVISKAKPVSASKQLATTQPTPAKVSHTPGKGYECRVCHVFFENINILQRHKCAKAHEFLMKHKLTAPNNRQRQLVSLQSASSSLQKGVTSVLSPSTGSTNVRGRLSNVNNKDTTVVADDDCFIVESGSEKPAEVIYQVTSSVPIKT